MAKSNRFSALRELRDQRQEDDVQKVLDQDSEQGLVTQSSDIAVDTEVKPKRKKVQRAKPNETKKPTKSITQISKRGPGRPRGRRSDPNYTQISAYIPLELLLEVQDELAEERREQKQRTPRPVSDLMEELLTNWMKKRKRKKSST